MADYLKDAQIFWPITYLLMGMVLMISVAAYHKASKILSQVQQFDKSLANQFNLLENKLKLLETLHDERLLRLKAQIEIVSIASQTSYIFKFAPDTVRQQLKQFEPLFIQLETIEKLSYECEVNSENLYREAESWGNKIEPKAYEQLLSKANLFRQDAKKQLQVTKLVKDKLHLYEFK